MSRAAATSRRCSRAPASRRTAPPSRTGRPSTSAAACRGPRCACASCSATTVQNAPGADQVLITYPIDPLFGQVLPVWRRQTLRGKRVVVVDVREGFRRMIPIDWTDLRPSPRCPRTKRGLVVFDPWILVGLSRAVAEKLTATIAGSKSARFERADADKGGFAAPRSGQRARKGDARSRTASRNRAVVRRRHSPQRRRRS